MVLIAVPEGVEFGEIRIVLTSGVPVFHSGRSSYQ
jgi:hypothetical protein